MKFSRHFQNLKYTRHKIKYILKFNKNLIKSIGFDGQNELRYFDKFTRICFLNRDIFDYTCSRITH